MSLEEVSRATRVPIASIERIEADRFDELPGEVFVRGFLKSYARAVGLPADDVLARYTASRRVAWVTPLPLSTPNKPNKGGRFGVAIAFVLLLFLLVLAVSIVLKPRGHDMPQELSRAPKGNAPWIAHLGSGVSRARTQPYEFVRTSSEADTCDPQAPAALAERSSHG